MRTALHRRERGYVLMEAMVGGAVLMLAMAGLMGAFSQASQQLGQSTADQRAVQLAMEQVEHLRMLPVSSEPWKVGTANCLLSPLAPLPDGWSCVIEVSPVTDSNVQPWVGGSLSYRRAEVTVSYRGTSWSLETVRW